MDSKIPGSTESVIRSQVLSRLKHGQHWIDADEIEDPEIECFEEPADALMSATNVVVRASAPYVVVKTSADWAPFICPAIDAPHITPAGVAHIAREADSEWALLTSKAAYHLYAGSGVLTFKMLGSARRNDRPQDPAREMAAGWLKHAKAALGEVRHPNVSTDPFGSAVIEWWNRDKKLTVFVGRESPVEYLQVWGPDIHSQMQEGVIDSDDKLRELWAWLNQP